MNYIEHFKSIARECGNKTAIFDLDGKRRTTYSALDELSGRVVGKLRALGCKKGDFILIHMGRRMEYIAAYIGILKAGCCVALASHEYPEERVLYIKKNCDAVLVIEEDFFDDIENYSEAEYELAEDTATALLVYTSGSTGRPKGILYTVYDFNRVAERQSIMLDGIEDVNYMATVALTFLAHVFEIFSVFFICGTTHIISEETRRSIRAEEDYIEKFGINSTFISPQMLKIFKNRSSSLRRIITGSERVSRFYDPSYEAYAIYGMSETGFVSVFHIDKSYDNTPVGKAFDDVELLVCDDDGKRLPDGTEGEICFLGKFGVTYFKDPEKTAKVMQKQSDGRVLIHSGDIGYVGEDGNFIYVNRKDWMVKINGQRVETLEVEILISEIENINNAAVKAFEDRDGQTYLAAYYTSSAAVNQKEIKTELEKKLPAYMIPRYFVRLDAMPKNQNGKLNRLALMPPKADDFRTEYAVPETEAQARLCRAFEEVLGCGRVGAADDFFMLGGDSIKTLKLVEKAGISRLSPAMIFEGRTPRGIEALMSKKEDVTAEHIAVQPESFMLTSSQLGVYLESVAEPDSVKYNIPFKCRLPHGTDAARFVSAVKTVVSSHPAFFGTVSAADGTPKMICKKTDITVTEKTAEDIDAECAAFLRPFDLERGPLFRFELCHTDAADYFLFDVHHIIFDGSSVKLFLEQTAKAYDGGGTECEKLTLADVSAYEKKLFESEKYREALEFFREKLSGAEVDSKPVSDRLLRKKSTGVGKIIARADGLLDITAAERFVKSEGITENTLFMSAFAYTLAKFNGAEECAFCTVTSGRYGKHLDSTIGMFVKTLPLYFSFDENRSVKEFLKETQNDFFATINRDFVSFGDLASEHGVNADVSFVYQSDLLGGVGIAEGTVDTDEIPLTDTASALQLMVLKKPEGYEIILNYKNELYTRELAQSFARMFLCVAKGMTDSERLCDIEFTGDASRRELKNINKTEYPYDKTKTVVGLFRAQTAKTPDAICLAFGKKRYTYREVDELTDRLAKHLVRLGIGREKIVGVLIPRCEYMLICALGALKAGGAYLPLDPSYPQERLNLMMRDSGASVLITTPEYRGIISREFSGARMMTDEIPALADSDIALPNPRPSDLFVMIYTSGSTGLPKGVMFEHSNAAVTTEWVKKYFDMDSSSRVTAYASYGFDANVFDMYPPITCGAQLHIIAEDMRLDFIELQKYFNENGITHTVMTTQVGRQFALLGGLKTLKHISVAGEKLTPTEVPEGFALYNLYGPTEGSVVTSGCRVDEDYRDVPIGKAVDNLKVYIVDKNRRLLPTGAVGELWIAGPHVTRGYLNRPEKTAEAYGGNPFESDGEYSRVYRTGDIVRLCADGNLQFIGRRDAQVKIRGFRVELTEIEEVVRRFPNVSDATVAAFDDAAGGKFVAAYVVSDTEIDTSALADFVRAEKPPYMVPAVIMQIDSIPLNQNQKVNRKLLPVPERKQTDDAKPENDTQKAIFDIVSEIVGHTSFGINTSIYDAGISSVSAIRLSVSLAEKFGVPIKIADLKANDTVKKLDGFISSAEKSEKYEIFRDYALTQTQNGIFVECMANPGTTIYNIPILFRLSGGVDILRLSDAIKTAINAHPYIKTKLFAAENGEIRAERNDGDAVTVQIKECSFLPKREDLVVPFALTGAPLYRITIYKTDGGNYLFMDFHHIIGDGESSAILLDDINRAYAGKPVEAEIFTGFDVSLEEEKLRSGEKYENAKNYYEKLLSGCDGSCLPVSAPEVTDGTSSSGGISRAATLSAKEVKSFCEKNRLTPNAFFNGVFGMTLGCFCFKEQVLFTTVYNGRSDSRLSRCFTMLVKTIPVSADMSGEKTVVEFLRGIQNQLMNSMENDIYSFAEISRAYSVKSDIIFVYQGDSFEFNTIGGERAENIYITPGTVKAPITVNVFVRDGRFAFDIDYRKDMYCVGFAESLSDTMTEVARSFLECEYLKDVSFVSNAAEKQYAILNANDKPFENIPCSTFISRYAKSHPEKTAVIACGEKLTFGELDTLSDRMANSLIKLGVKADTIVGMVPERTKEVFITELGIMKAGGAFLPMLPGYPDDRIEYCLTNSESPIVITTEKIRSERKDLFSDKKPYRTVTAEELLRGDADEAPDIEIPPDSLAYCIYTSGSTGTPKGVMVEHHNISNLVDTHRFIYENVSESGVALEISSVSFDMSLYEILLPLCSGVTVCMATEDEIHDPMRLKTLMLENSVQAVVCTPSFMTNMISIPEFTPAVKGLRTIVVGAEAFPAPLYSELKKHSPDICVINGYGPTECTVCCSTKKLDSGENVTIGRPTPNAKMFVTDKMNRVLPPYASGELIICGEGVGRGYIKLPEKNAAMFFKLRGYPAYHSGDLVRLGRNAEIEFFGRLDNQVKIRGYRVELDEIENVMREYGCIRQSKVVVRNNGSEDYLAGFFTADEKTDIAGLTEYMKGKLTYYMVPAVLMQLDAMPLTSNGKIDKAKLPEVTKSNRRDGRRAPKKSLEQRLCEIFKTVLSLDECYADDDFFELGGTSLSASKVTMLLMSEGIEVKYGDIFDNATPSELAEFIESRNAKETTAKPSAPAAEEKTGDEALKYNTVKYASEVVRESIGNVFLTGAVGFLGVHVLYDLLENEAGHIWCLVRKGSYRSSDIRLKTMMMYYFGRGFDEELKTRITVVDADITDSDLYEKVKDIPFDTVINCAACVKHFAEGDILTQINVHGVENLIDVCKKKNAKMVQISTVSVPGIHTKESYERQVKMHENELFIIDSMDNKYGISKYTAELRMLDAIRGGMRGKIIRVGNLMGRYSDGEFQANAETNMFMSGIRGFATMGKYPISHMTDPMKFSPVDCTARAIVLLAGTNDKFTAFNADNRYGFDEMKIIDACNRNGITIVPTDDESYYAEFNQKLGNDKINSKLNGLAAYDIKDAHAVETDNLFTTNILYRIGFSWPLVDDTYLDRAISSIMSLDYFDSSDIAGV